MSTNSPMRTPREKSKGQSHENTFIAENSARISLLEDGTTLNSTRNYSVSKRKRKTTEICVGDKSVASKELTINTDITKEREFVFKRSDDEMKNITIGVNDIDICLLLHAKKDNLSSTNMSDCVTYGNDSSVLRKKRKISLEIENNCVHISHDFPKVELTPFNEQSSRNQLTPDRIHQINFLQNNILLQCSPTKNKIRQEKNPRTVSNALSSSDDIPTIVNNFLDATITTMPGDQKETRTQKKKKANVELNDQQNNSLDDDINTSMVQELSSDKIVTSTPYFNNVTERKQKKVKSHEINVSQFSNLNFQHLSDEQERAKKRKKDKAAVSNDAPVLPSLQTSDYNSLTSTEYSEPSESVRAERKKKKKVKCNKNQDYVATTSFVNERAANMYDIAVSLFPPVPDDSDLSSNSAIHDTDNKKRNETFKNDHDSQHSRSIKESHENEDGNLAEIDDNRKQEENSFEACPESATKQKKKDVLADDVDAHIYGEKHEDLFSQIHEIDENRTLVENISGVFPESAMKQKKKRKKNVLANDFDSHDFTEKDKNEDNNLFSQSGEIDDSRTLVENISDVCPESATKQKKKKKKNVLANDFDSHDFNDRHKNELASQNDEIEPLGREIDENMTQEANDSEVCPGSATKQKKKKKKNILVDDVDSHDFTEKHENNVASQSGEIDDSRTQEDNISEVCPGSATKQKKKKKKHILVDDVDSHDFTEKHENELASQSGEIDNSRTQEDNISEVCPGSATKQKKKKKKNILVDDVDSHDFTEKHKNNVASQSGEIDDSRTQEDNISEVFPGSATKQKKKKKKNILVDDVDSHDFTEKHENGDLFSQRDEDEIDDNKTPEENISDVYNGSITKQKRKNKKNEMLAAVGDSHDLTEKHENELASQNDEIETICSGVDDKQTQEENSFKICPGSATKQKKKRKKNVSSDDVDSRRFEERNENDLPSQNDEIETIFSGFNYSRTQEENGTEVCPESATKQKRKKKKNVLANDVDSHGFEERHENELASQNDEIRTICSVIDDGRTQEENNTEVCPSSVTKGKRKKAKKKILVDVGDSQNFTEKLENELASQNDKIETLFSEINDSRTQEENISDVCPGSATKQKNKNKKNEMLAVVCDSHDLTEKHENELASQNDEIETIFSGFNYSRTQEENGTEVCPESATKQKRKKKKNVLANDVDSHGFEKIHENELASQNDEIRTICSVIDDSRTQEENNTEVCPSSVTKGKRKKAKKKILVDVGDSQNFTEKLENELASQNDKIRTICSVIDDGRTQEENNTEVCPSSVTKGKRKKAKKKILVDVGDSQNFTEKLENELASQNDEIRTICSVIDDSRMQEDNNSDVYPGSVTKQKKKKNVLPDDVDSCSYREKCETEDGNLASQRDEIDDSRTPEENISDVCPGSATKQKKKNKKNEMLADVGDSHDLTEKHENELASQNDEIETICSEIDDSRTQEENGTDVCPESATKQKRKKKKNVLANDVDSHGFEKIHENELASQNDEIRTICSVIDDSRTPEENGTEVCPESATKQKKKNDVDSRSFEERHANELASQLDEIETICSEIDDSRTQKENSSEVCTESVAKQKKNVLVDDENSWSALHVQNGNVSSDCEKNERSTKKKKKNTNEAVIDGKQCFDDSLTDNCVTPRRKTKKGKIAVNSFLNSTVFSEKSDNEQTSEKEENRSLNANIVPTCTENSLPNDAIHSSDDLDIGHQKKKEKHKTVHPEENITDISEYRKCRKKRSKIADIEENVSNSVTDCSEIGTDNKTGKKQTVTKTSDEFVFAKPKEKRKKKNMDLDTISRNSRDDQISVEVCDNENDNDDTESSYSIQDLKHPEHSDSSDTDGHSTASKKKKKRDHSQEISTDGKEPHQKKRNSKIAMAEAPLSPDYQPNDTSIDQIAQRNHTELSTTENEFTSTPMNQNDESVILDSQSIILDSQVGDDNNQNLPHSVGVKLTKESKKSQAAAAADKFQTDRLENLIDPSRKVEFTTTEDKSSRVENVRKQLSFGVDKFYSRLSQGELIERPQASAKFQAASNQEQNINNISNGMNLSQHSQTTKVSEWLNNVFISDQISEDDSVASNNNEESHHSLEIHSKRETNSQVEEADIELSNTVDFLLEKTLSAMKMKLQNKLNRSKSSTNNRKKVTPLDSQRGKSQKAVAEQTKAENSKTKSVSRKGKQCFEFPSQKNDIPVVSPSKSLDNTTCDGRLASFYKMLPKPSTLNSSSMSLTSFNSSAISLRLQNTTLYQSIIGDANLEVTSSSETIKTRQAKEKEKDLESTCRSPSSRNAQSSNLEVSSPRGTVKTRQAAANEKDLESTHHSELSNNEDDSDTGEVDLKDKTKGSPVERLEDLKIAENFAVHKEHCVETIYQNENGESATGEFLLKEDGTIKENWRTFCKLYNFKASEYIYFTLEPRRTSISLISSHQHLLFAKFLGQKLPQRSLRSILERFPKLMSHSKSISLKERDFMIKYRNGPKVLSFGKIAKRLNLSLGIVKSYYYRHKLDEIEWSCNDDSSDVSSTSVIPELEDSELSENSELSSSISSEIASHTLNTREESNEKKVAGKSISKDLSRETGSCSKVLMEDMDDTDSDGSESKVLMEDMDDTVSDGSESKMLMEDMDDTDSDDMGGYPIDHEEVKLEQLRMLSIEEDFKVVKGHRIETSLFRTANENVMQALAELGMTISKRYSPFEDDAIKRNWRKFCKLYNFDVERDHVFFTTGKVNGKISLGSKEHIKFARFLGQGLPKRSLRSIMCRFATKLNPAVQFIKMWFGPHEDEYILKHREGSEILTYKEIARDLGRSEASVKGRYHKLKGCDYIASGSMKKYCKDKALLSEQIQLLMKTCGFTSVDDLREKTRDLNYPISWSLIHGMGIDKDRIGAVLWRMYLHTALHITQVHDSIDVTLRMIQILKETPEICCKEEIVWRDMAEHFPGFHSAHLNQIFLHSWHNRCKKFINANTSWQDALELFEVILLQQSSSHKIYPLKVAQDGTVLELPCENSGD